MPAAAPLLCRCGSVCSLGLGGRKIIGWGCLSRAVVGSVRVHAGVMHCCGRRRGIQVESPGHASLASASAERATAVSTSGRSRAPVLHFERRVCYVYRASYMRPTLCSRGHPLLCSPWYIHVGGSLWYIHVGGGFLSFLSPSDKPHMTGVWPGRTKRLEEVVRGILVPLVGCHSVESKSAWECLSPVVRASCASTPKYSS